MLQWSVLLIYLLLVAVGLALFIHAAYTSIPAARSAWHEMSRFERYCLLVGLWTYLGLPALTTNPSASPYFGQFTSEIVGAIANGLFLVGVLAFLSRLHAESSKNEG